MTKFYYKEKHCIVIWFCSSNYIKKKPFLSLARIGFLSLFSFLVMTSYDILLQLDKLVFH